MPREMFWNQVLKPLAQVSNRVTFLGQYLFNTLRYHYDKRPASATWSPEVVAWLLTHLDRSSPSGTHVGLMEGTGVPNSPRDSEEAALMTRSQWKPADERRVASVEVSAGPWLQS